MSKMQSVLADTKRLRSFHKKVTLFWVANFPLVMSIFLFASDDGVRMFCLVYLVLVSVVANIIGSLATWMADREDVKVEERRLVAEAYEDQYSL